MGVSGCLLRGPSAVVAERGGGWRGVWGGGWPAAIPKALWFFLDVSLFFRVVFGDTGLCVCSWSYSH